MPSYSTSTGILSNRGTESTNNSLSVMDPTDDSVFTAGLDDVTTMSKILHELHHGDDHSVLVITREGIRLITAGEKTFQVSAYFPASSFQRYKFDHDHFPEVNFRFILRDFIECLNLLRDDPILDNQPAIQLVDESNSGDVFKTSLYIQYRRLGDPLKLRLENKSNYVINCDLKAFNVPRDAMFSPLAFPMDEDTATIGLDSKRLYEYVSGLDFNSSKFVHLVMCRGGVPLKLSTESTELGEVVLEITENATDIIRSELSVSQNLVYGHSYRSQFIKPALEALKNSTTMQMKCGAESGLLCIEHFHGPDKSDNEKLNFWLLSCNPH